MPIIKSAKKRVRVAKKAATRNSKTKRSLRAAVKSFRTSLTKGGAKSSEALRQAQSEIDKAAKKNVIHKNKAARKQSQLAKAAKAAGVKPAAAKAKSTAKSAAKPKPATKKAPAKKTTAKTTAKKPATAKKAPAKAKKTTAKK